ncbi:hypothetical protein GUI12_01415 [Anaplasmataceae bacterium AB001_6]|nr:hypothetical protein GUI12_01415 [Anaplasmataceae bacterium AB001_6]
MFDRYKNNAFRPTKSRVRDAIYDFLQHYYDSLDEKIMYDLYCGSAAVSLNILNKLGLKKLYLVDTNTSNIDSNALDNQKVVVLASDVLSLRIGKKGLRKADIVFLDPPYDSKLADRTIQNMLKYDMLKPESLIICEISSKYLFQNVPKDLSLKRVFCYGLSKIVIFEYSAA